MAYPIPSTSTTYPKPSRNEVNTKHVTFAEQVDVIGLPGIAASGDIAPSLVQSTAISSRGISQDFKVRKASDTSEASVGSDEMNIPEIKLKQYCTYTRTSSLLKVPETAILHGCLKCSILAIDEDNVITRLPVKIKKIRSGYAYLSRKNVFKDNWRVRFITQDIGIQPGTLVDTELKKALRRMESQVEPCPEGPIEIEPFDMHKLSRLFKATRTNESFCCQFYKYCAKKQDQPIVNELIRMLKRLRLFILTAFEKNHEEIRFTANFALAIYAHHKQHFNGNDLFKDIDDIYNNIFTSIENAITYYGHDSLSIPLYTMTDNELSFQAINERLNLHSESILFLVEIMQNYQHERKQRYYPLPIQEKIKQFNDSANMSFTSPTYDTASLISCRGSEESLYSERTPKPVVPIRLETRV